MTDEPASNEPEFFRVGDLARRLGVTAPHVYHLIQRGQLKAISLGECLRVPREEVERLLREGTGGVRRGRREKRKAD